MESSVLFQSLPLPSRQSLSLNLGSTFSQPSWRPSESQGDLPVTVPSEPEVTGLCKTHGSLCGYWDLTYSLLDCSSSALTQRAVSPNAFLFHLLSCAEKLG